MSIEPSHDQADLLARLRQAHRLEALPRGIEQRLLERIEPGRSSAWGAGRSARACVGALARPGVLAWAALVVLVGAALSANAWVTRERQATAVVGAEPLADGQSAGPPEQHTSPSPQNAPSSYARPCPQAEVPEGATIAPARADVGVERAGLTLHTFAMQTPGCGRITRRYVELVPDALPPRSSAPVLLAIHADGQSAEAMRSDRTLKRFDDEARIDGFILVYANAAPGAGTNPAIINSGSWQTDGRANPEVDDEAYLERVISDMLQRGVIDGHNPLFLVGQAGGAAMALTAAAGRPGIYSGVAAFGPVPGQVTQLTPSATPPRLSRVLFVASREQWTDAGARDLARAWAAALRISQPMRERRWRSRAASPSIEQLDLVAPASGAAAVRLLLVSPPAEPAPLPGSPFMARLAWEFFTGAGASDAPPLAGAQAPLLLEGDLLLEDDLGDFIDAPSFQSAPE